MHSRQYYIDAMTQCGIPAYCQEPLADYIMKGSEVGDFLYYLLCNDLVRAVAHADANNSVALKGYGQFLYSYVPQKAWGDAARVRAWVSKNRPNHIEGQGHPCQS